MSPLSRPRGASVHRRFHLAVVSLGVLAGTGDVASAGIINGVTSGSGGGGLFVNNASFASPDPGNDNVLGQSTNTLWYDEGFSNNFAGASQYFWVAGPATEYTVTLDIDNNTGTTWYAFDCYCGASTIDVPVYYGGLVFDFDLAPAMSGPGTGGQTWSSINDNWISFAGLNIPAGASIQIVFNLDVLVLGDNGGPLIFQRPYDVPAPGVLGAVGLSGMIGARRRRPV
jgi:hypothetical protein